MPSLKHIGIAGTSEGAVNTFQKMLLKEAGYEDRPKISLRFADFAAIQEVENRGNMVMVGRLMRKPIEELLQAGADFVVIPSNAVQARFHTLRSHFHEKLPLDLVEMTIKEASQNTLKKPGFFAVSTTVKEGVYMEGLRKLGMDPVVLEEEDQAFLDQIVYKKLSKKEELNSGEKLHLRQAVDHLQKKGIDGSVIACTDLSVLYSQLTFLGPVVDSTRLLVQNTLEYARQKG